MDIIRVNSEPIPNENNGSGSSIFQGAAGSKHHQKQM